MSPASAAIRVDKMRTIVVLPAPLGPSRAKMVPSATVRSTPPSTMCSPKDLRTAWALIAGLVGLIVTGFLLSVM
jgi:transposase